MVTAIMQFGIVFRNYMQLTDAVRSGARVAAVSRSATNPTATVQAAVANAGGGMSLPPSAVAVTSTWQSGADVTVAATYPYAISIFGIPLKSGSLRSSITQRVE